LADFSKLRRLAINEDFATCRRFHAGDDSHQRALACPVFADDGKHFASFECQRYIRECTHAGKLLANAANFQERRRSRWHHGGPALVASGQSAQRHFLPSRSLISFQNASTFGLSITRAGMSMNLLSGIIELLPLCSSLSARIDS